MYSVLHEGLCLLSLYASLLDRRKSPCMWVLRILICDEPGDRWYETGMLARETAWLDRLWVWSVNQANSTQMMKLKVTTKAGIEAQKA